MNKNPLFSVLIANYNNGKYLMDAIESLCLLGRTEHNYKSDVTFDCVRL